MRDRHLVRRRIGRLLAVLALAVLGLGAGIVAGLPAASAQPSPTASPPPVSPPPEGRGFAITVEDKVPAVRPGDTLTYEVTLRNTTRAVAAANIELTLPVGATAVTVGNGGQAPEPWYAKWTLDVPAEGAVTVSAAFVVGPPVGDAIGHAASACLVENFARLICAADIDQLLGPADIYVDAAAGRKLWDHRWFLPAVAAGLVLLAAAVYVGWRLHRRWIDDNPDDSTPGGGGSGSGGTPGAGGGSGESSWFGASGLFGAFGNSSGSGDTPAVGRRKSTG